MIQTGALGSLAVMSLVTGDVPHIHTPFNSVAASSYAYGLSLLETKGFTMSGEPTCGYLDPNTKTS